MQLKTILENVRLNYLLEREESGWDANLNWEDILSLGEQQRLGMVCKFTALLPLLYRLFILFFIFPLLYRLFICITLFFVSDVIFFFFPLSQGTLIFPQA